MGTLFITNTIGFISSLVCIILFIIIALKDPKFVNRITLRLQVALSAVDFIGHILLYLHEGTFSKGACSFLGFAVVYQNSVYVTIVFFVTLVLHMNFLVSNKFNGKYEKLVWVAAAALPLIHNLPPYALNMFGLDNKGYCFFDTEKLNNEILAFTNLIVPTTVVFIYSLVVTLIILYKVRTDYSLTDHIINTSRFSDITSRKVLRRLLQSWILRLIMYPAAFCLMDSGIVVDFFLQIVFGYSSEIVFYWAAVGGRLSGLFNLIAFLLDPYTQYAFKKVYQSYKNPHQNYPANLVSGNSNHQIKLTDFSSTLTDPRDGHSAILQNEDLDEEEAVTLLQGCIKNC